MKIRTGRVGEFLATAAPWAAIAISLVALGESILPIKVNSIENSRATGAAVRGYCLAWAQFVISEQDRHVPDFRIDDEGALLSQTTLGTVNQPASELAHDTIPNVCGSAESLRKIRDR